MARPTRYFSSDLIINPTVSQRAAAALNRARERGALEPYGKVWEKDERAFDGRTQFHLWSGLVFMSAIWAGFFVPPVLLVAQGYATAGAAFAPFLWIALIVFAIFTLASYGLVTWKGAIVVFACQWAWPLALPVLVIMLLRRWPYRYAERYHRRYVVPATDFDEAATALWTRAVDTATVLAGPAGWAAEEAVPPRMWAIAELLARSALPAEQDQRSALLEDAAIQVDSLGRF